jgi:hypothetical protein
MCFYFAAFGGEIKGGAVACFLIFLEKIKKQATE